MLPAPHPMVEGVEEHDYYHGKVTRATAEQEESGRSHRRQNEDFTGTAGHVSDRRSAGPPPPVEPRRPTTPVASSRPERLNAPSA